MNTNGFSLFQGGESLHINASQQSEELNKELEEDKKRHEAELGAILENAFDDIDDVDSTMGDHEHDEPAANPALQPIFGHMQQPVAQPIFGDRPRPVAQPIFGDRPQPVAQPIFGNGQHDVKSPNPGMLGPPQNLRHNDQAKPYDDMCDNDEALHTLRMKLRASENEKEHFQRLARDGEMSKNSLQQRLSHMSAELERVHSEKHNNHELLIESKAKCSELEDRISRMQSEQTLLENEKAVLSGKLETAQTLLSDLQLKHDTYALEYHKRDERSAANRLKLLEERHEAEKHLMQEKINQLQSELSGKRQELENLNSRYTALQASNEQIKQHDALRLRELSEKLEDVENELESKASSAAECQRLNKLVSEYETTCSEMQAQINMLSQRLQSSTSELELVEGVLQQYSADDTPKGLRDMRNRAIGSTPLTTTDRVGRIKDELSRALSDVKAKRQELRRLTAENANLRAEENRALVQINTLSEEKSRLESKVRVLQAELSDKVSPKKLDEEFVKLRQEYETLLASCESEKLARTEYELKSQTLAKRVRELEEDTESLRADCEQAKRDCARLSAEKQASADSITLELERHKILLNNAQEECTRLKKLYTELANAKENLAYELDKLRGADNVKELQEQRAKVANLQRSLQLAEIRNTELRKIMEADKERNESEVRELREQLERVKVNLSKSTTAAAAESDNGCAKCIELATEITKREIENLKLSNTSSAHKNELQELKEKLRDKQSALDKLNEDLSMMQEQKRRIAQLERQASELNEQLQIQRCASHKSLTPPTRVSPKGCERAATAPTTPTTAHTPRAEIKAVEARIRNEMAQIFATELKRFQVELRRVEEQHASLQHEYQRVRGELTRREREVQVLTESITAERENIEELLKEKQSEFGGLLEQHNAVLHKCRDELHARNKRLKQLEHELAERQAQIDAERASMQKVMKHWEDNGKRTDAIEREWRERLQQLQAAHDAALQAMEKRYASAKRTAANYKRYADDKEQHMMREFERLKKEYDLSLTKIEARANETLERKLSTLSATTTTNSNWSPFPEKSGVLSARLDENRTANKENLPNN